MPRPELVDPQLGQVMPERVPRPRDEEREEDQGELRVAVLAQVGQHLARDEPGRVQSREEVRVQIVERRHGELLGHQHQVRAVEVPPVRFEDAAFRPQAIEERSARKRSHHEGHQLVDVRTAIGAATARNVSAVSLSSPSTMFT